MAKRAITAKEQAWLQDELGVWRRDGIITEQQAQRITGLYQGAGEIAEQRRSKSVFVLMAAAATLVGLAVLLLMGYNWSQLDRLTKLGIVLGVVAVTHALGFSLRYGKQAKRASELVFFLGCVFYGAGIWLVAQAFHLDSHYPDGFWWWAVGVLPFALCLETRLLHALVVGILGVWAGLEILEFGFLGGWLFGRWDAIPNAAYSLPLLALPGIIWAYKRQSVPTLSLYVPLLAWWTVLQVFAWKLGSNPIYFVGAVGALLLVAAECHRPGSRFAVPYRYYGSLLVGGALVPLSFLKLNKELAGDYSRLAVPPTVLAIVAFAVVLLTGRAGGRADGSTSSSHWDTIARRQAIPLGISLLMVLLPVLAAASGKSAALAPTVLVNVAMVAGAFWLMQIGLRDDRGRPFGAGVLYFLLWAILRYVDLFGGAGGMVGAATMFFGCGAVLFAVAKYWQGRKEVRYA
jgi:uncharacterized membrane protein